MNTLAYGAAANATQTEKFFADPVRGVFAVVETLGDAQFGEKLLEGVAEINPGEEQYFGLLQYRAGSLLKEFRKSAVSFALVRCRGETAHWIRVGASGISTLNQQRILPVCPPQVWNPRSLSGEEYALPAGAMGIGAERWEQGSVSFLPGEFLALHTSGFPVFAPGLPTVLSQLGVTGLEALAQELVGGAWWENLKASAVVLVGAPRANSGAGVPNL